MSGAMRRLFYIIIFVWLIGLSISSWARSADPPPDDLASLGLHDLDGVPRDLVEYRGQIVVLNFWATWCLPCLEEMPILLEIRERYAARGVEVVAASADDATTREAVPEFVRRHKLSFPVWVGAMVEDMRGLGLGDALPATAILDAEGRVAFRIRGKVNQRDLEERIDFLLGDGPGPAPTRLIESFEGADHDEHGDHHDHEGEEEHEHGGVGMEGGSLVPS